MRRSAITAAFVALGVALVLLMSSIFVVDERQKALVLQFGQIRQIREDPGLYFKVPFIQDVVKYPDLILSLDTETIEVTPSDDRRLIVDAFARYRIDDPVRFRQAVGAGGIVNAENLLSTILNASIREVLGADQVTSDVILSSERGALMIRIRDLAQTEAQDIGLNVVDVRLKQTNLPEQNLEATFARMRAEREREAADEIARGNEAAQRVRATSDRTVTETISAAERDGEITRGEADAEANRVFADAYGADPEFFQFYRSMQAYEQALQGSNSTLVLTPNNAFFDYLYGGAALTSGGALAPSAVIPSVTQDEGAALESGPGAAEAAAETAPALEPLDDEGAGLAAGEPDQDAAVLAEDVTGETALATEEAAAAEASGAP